jgi:hypothetical protein
MVDRAGHLEGDPGVAPLLPPRARVARSPTVALVAAAIARFETWDVEWIPRTENRRTDALGRAR